MKENKLLTAALDYARRGIPVIPLHNPEPTGSCSCGKPDCDRIGKHPRTNHGVRDATTDEGLIRSWWWSWPAANIGLAMGQGRVALDVDLAEALEVWEAKHGDLPKGPRQFSGRPGGEHRLFQCSTKLRNAVKFASGLDIRTDGGYIVGAPSIHASGRTYEWDPDYDLDVELPELPKAIVKLCAEKAKVAADDNEHQPLDPALVLLGIAEGQRNDTLYRYACRLLGYNHLSLVEVRPLVVQAGKACKPPLSDDEISAVIRSASKHAPTPAVEQPIPISTPPPPTFPLEALPDPLQSYTTAVATSVQIPVDAVAMMVLSALSVCTARRVLVQLPTHAEWTNTYAVVALPPGSRKSSAFAAVFGVLREMQAKWQMEVAPEIALRRDLRETEEKTIAALKARASKAKSEAERQRVLEQITAARASMTPELALPQIVISGDVTQERLAQILAEQGERLAILDAEGTLFDLIAGLYSNLPNFDLLLKCWRGDAHSVERIGRESIQLQAPLLTLCLTTQPSVISKVSENKTFRGRGLLGRILFCTPPSLVGTRLYHVRPIDKALVADYSEAIRQTFRATWADEQVAHVTNGALKAWSAFHDDVERRQASGGDLENLPDFASKIAGIVAGIAGSLYAFDHRYGTPPGTIADRHMDAAIQIGDWALGHAKYAFAKMAETVEHDYAIKILDWIRREQVKTVTSRAVLRAFRSIRRSDLDNAMETLIRFGHIKPCGVIQTGGRPKGPFFEVVQ